MSNDIIPWDEIPNDYYSTSDVHIGDPDGATACAVHPEHTGHGLWEIMTPHIQPCVNGDFLNYPTREAMLRLMRFEDDCTLDRVIAGNHDADMIGAVAVGYDSCDWDVRDKTIYMHGHQAQRLWDHRLKVGQWIVRLGDAMEQVVPWSDNVIMAAAHGINRTIVPRGWRESREVYLKWGAGVLEEYSCTMLVHGHTHEAGVWGWDVDGECWRKMPAVYAKARIVRSFARHIIDTGSWMPAHRDHPRGWYEAGEVAPFVWGESERTLYRVWSDGLEVAARLEGWEL